MAFKRVNSVYFMADSKEDLRDLPASAMGAECYVISEACEYKANSKGEWIIQRAATVAPGSVEVDLTGYATEKYVDEAVAGIEVPNVDGLATEKYVDEAVANVKVPSIEGLASEKDLKALMEELKACYHPVKYGITNVPHGTLVDYREKEIRIMCPEDAEFKKQQVGETGNPNYYYMTFTCYAPEGAVSLKEGDRGVIVDEMINLDGGSGCGTDKFGRKYKNHWFALALHDEDDNTWTYLGKNSNAEKYIGWTYIVEWYDKDGVVIAADKIRLNLSNEGCHLDLKPYLG